MTMDERDVLEWVSAEENFRKIRHDVARRILYEAQHQQPMVCEHDACDSDLTRMLEHTERVWSAYGLSDPHWSVVTAPRFRRDAITENQREFYDLGKREAQALDLLLARNSITIPPTAHWLEYGCGVGRVTRWLAQRAGHITGADISLNHLRLASGYCRSEGILNVDWVQIKSIEDIKGLPRFDVFYSKIVLQHNPPPIIVRTLDLVLSRANSGAVAIFQVPTYRKGYEFRVEKYLREMSGISALEMHVLPQRIVFELLHTHGFVPVEVVRDHLVSQADYISNTFVGQRHDSSRE